MLTEFGTAQITTKGYYRITTNEKGYRGELLHRLIYCKHNNCTLEDINGLAIHHIDRNKSNNNFDNLIAMPISEHCRMHAKEMVISEQTRKKMSESKKGTKIPENTKKKMSKSKNTTGYFRVSILKSPTCTQGFRYVYKYLDGPKTKTLSSVNIHQLKQKVIDKGLEWYEFNENSKNEGRMQEC